MRDIERNNLDKNRTLYPNIFCEICNIKFCKGDKIVAKDQSDFQNTECRVIHSKCVSSYNGSDKILAKEL